MCWYAEIRLDLGRLNVAVEVLLKRVVHWHLMMLAALLVEPESR